MPSYTRNPFLLNFFILVLACTVQAQQSQPSRAAAIWDSMPHAHSAEQVAISPDGTKIAFTDGAHVFLAPLAPNAPIKTFAAPNDLPVRDLAWSPDSAHIAFIADTSEEKPAAELYFADPNTTRARKLADFHGYVSTPRFSPDGKTLAVLFIENMPRIAGALVPMTPPEGTIEEHVYEQRITTVDIVSGAVRQVSPADIYVYEYDWSPDGRSWASTAAHGSGDNNWWIARLYTIDAQSGALHEVYKPKLQIDAPRFSPDGKSIAFIHGIMSDFGSTGGDVFVVPATGGEARNLTPEMKASASWLTWTSPTQLLFTANVDGDSAIATVTTRGGDMKVAYRQFESFFAGDSDHLSLARDGKTSAVVRSSFAAPPEIWAGPIGDWKQFTNYNASVKPAWGEARNVHWASDGQRVQGWLLFPRDYDAKQKYPLVVNVHGGPAAACMNRWNPSDGAFSAMNYFVLCPNPRGSFGQGEAFTQANVKDFGGGDFRDIMAGIDSLAREYPIDLERLGLRGHSYGGYMAMWAATQTNRFKAIVAGAGLSDWLSYYGENDIDEWMIPYFGASVYEDPKVYDKSSPIAFVKNVKTPTLILVGDRDGEVPAPQSFEWWHALKTLGVPNQFVVYPNEGHAISQPEHRRDYQVRSMEWFEKWFGSVGASPATMP
jgi:dipeptidyl aminopeptidase/acylaminoacyl peptidase